MLKYLKNAGDTREITIFNDFRLLVKVIRKSDCMITDFRTFRDVPHIFTHWLLIWFHLNFSIKVEIFNLSNKCHPSGSMTPQIVASINSWVYLGLYHYISLYRFTLYYTQMLPKCIVYRHLPFQKSNEFATFQNSSPLACIPPKVF